MQVNKTGKKKTVSIIDRYFWLKSIHDAARIEGCKTEEEEQWMEAAKLEKWEGITAEAVRQYMN